MVNLGHHANDALFCAVILKRVVKFDTLTTDFNFKGGQDERY